MTTATATKTTVYVIQYLADAFGEQTWTDTPNHDGIDSIDEARKLLGWLVPGVERRIVKREVIVVDEVIG